MENRVPFEFFSTTGAGDSHNEIHAGSFHIALHEAGISDYNIMTYSSVLPACAKRIEKSEAQLPQFGSELMTIMACAHGRKGETISAGVVFGWLYDGETKVGGLVCEVSGTMDENSLLIKLHSSLHELHERTYGHLKLGSPELITKTHFVKDTHGTALAALCFTSFK